MTAPLLSSPPPLERGPPILSSAVINRLSCSCLSCPVTLSCTRIKWLGCKLWGWRLTPMAGRCGVQRSIKGPSHPDLATPRHAAV